ncbi:MAG: zinc-ribbon domain-containing protein [Faecalibacterium sp.]
MWCTRKFLLTKPEEHKACPQCGAPVSDDALFCNKCGAQL